MSASSPMSSKRKLTPDSVASPTKKTKLDPSPMSSKRILTPDSVASPTKKTKLDPTLGRTQLTGNSVDDTQLYGQACEMESKEDRESVRTKVTSQHTTHVKPLVTTPKEVTFEIKQQGTKRGSDVLVGSDDHIYQKGMVKKNKQYWRCENRNKCNGSMNSAGGIYIFGTAHTEECNRRFKEKVEKLHDSERKRVSLVKQTLPKYTKYTKSKKTLGPTLLPQNSPVIHDEEPVKQDIPEDIRISKTTFQHEFIDSQGDISTQETTVQQDYTAIQEDIKQDYTVITENIRFSETTVKGLPEDIDIQIEYILNDARLLKEFPEFIQSLLDLNQPYSAEHEMQLAMEQDQSSKTKEQEPKIQPSSHNPKQDRTVQFDPDVPTLVPQQHTSTTTGTPELPQVASHQSSKCTSELLQTSTCTGVQASTYPSQHPSTSKQSRTDPSTSATGTTAPSIPPILRRRSTRTRTKFVGRRVQHKWEDKSGTDNWYSGLVLSVISGRDGDVSAVYQVQYDNDDEIYEVDDISKDFNEGNLKFDDI